MNDYIKRQDVLDLCESKDPNYEVRHFKEDVECLPSVRDRMIEVMYRARAEIIDKMNNANNTYFSMGCGFTIGVIERMIVSEEVEK